MDDEIIRMMCPNLGCQRVLAVPNIARGKLVRCRSCATDIRVPDARDLTTPRNLPEQEQPAQDVA